MSMCIDAFDLTGGDVYGLLGSPSASCSNSLQRRVANGVSGAAANLSPELMLESNETKLFLNHSLCAFSRIQEMFSFGKLCDVRLVCNEGKVEINAHRVILSSVSNYFYAMFTSSLVESQKNEIVMNDMNGDALRTLVSFIYNGKLDLNDSNAFSILDAANFLQLNAVIRYGCEYLTSSLNISNCLSIYRFSEEQAFLQLKATSQRFICDNFEKLVSNVEILNELNEVELETLFDDEYLNVKNEEFAFETLLKWINLNPTARTSLLGRLMAKIKLPLLKANYLTRQIETNKLLLTSECQSLLLEATLYHLSPEKFSTTPSSRTIPRKSTIGYLLCVGGVDHSRCSRNASLIEKYDFRCDKWTSLGPKINFFLPISSSNDRGSNSTLSSTFSSTSTMLDPNRSNSPCNNMLKRTHFGVALLNSDFLYIAGGREGLKTLNNVDCFDLNKLTWSQVSLMLTPRHHLKAVFLENEPILYVVGGHDGWSYLNSVERFDLENKSWSYVSPMNTHRSTMGVVILGNVLYAVGGRDPSGSLNSVECYNPLTNKWTNCASMNKRRGSVAVTALNGFVYAVGGNEGASTCVESVRYDCGERYDPKLDQWTLISSFTKRAESISLSNLSTSYMFIAGGYDGHKFMIECEKYDPVKNEWTKVSSLNTPRADAILVYIPGSNDPTKFIDVKSKYSDQKKPRKLSDEERSLRD